ncbi:MAG: metalloregulator ArsR/SmtB family transcription factor [Pseudomonadota bacterium]
MVRSIQVLDDVLSPTCTILKALASPARLRIALLCARSELSVGELVTVIGHSQPRVSQYLKVLIEAGVLTRTQEGARAYHRVVDDPPVRALLTRVAAMLVDDTTWTKDLVGLKSIWVQRQRRAEAYFDRHARRWDDIRRRDIASEAIDQVFVRLVDDLRPGRVLDIGCGTGHCMALLAERIEPAGAAPVAGTGMAGAAMSITGIDNAPAMLALARSKLSGLAHCHLRQADMMRLPFVDQAFDMVLVSMVLHYADDPGQALREARRVLRPGGAIVIIDLCEHNRIQLRESEGHRWLGFSDQALADWLTPVTITSIIVSAKNRKEYCKTNRKTDHKTERNIGLDCGVWWGRVPQSHEQGDGHARA